MGEDIWASLAGHQSFPLAQAGYEVTLLDPSAAMLDQARQRLERLPAEAQRRVTLLQADGLDAAAAVKPGGARSQSCPTVGLCSQATPGTSSPAT